MITVYPTRLFGGRNVGITFDDAANTLTIQGQQISLSSVSAALQAQWLAAVASAPPRGSRGAFGGDNIGQAVGAILDTQPTWRTAVQTAVSNYAASIASYGDPETWTH